MKKFEKVLNERFTEKIIELLNKGYLVLNNDSGMGYFQRIDLYKDDVLLRVYIERTSIQEDDFDFYGIIEKYEFKIVKMKINQTFIKDDDEVIFEEDFYIYKESLISENLEDLIEFSEKRKKRIENKFRKNLKKEFYPNQKINIKGFKCFKKKEVKITRHENYYELENPKTKNIKRVFFK